MLVLLWRAPHRFRVPLRRVPFLAVFGVVGVAAVQWLYFLAIHRLAIGIALLIQYLAPLLVALWARFVYREHVRRRIFVALALALAGLALVVDLRSGGTVSWAGVAFAGGACLGLAGYLLMAEHGVRERGGLSLLVWGFGFATAFFSVIAPWWSFPGHLVSADVSLLGHLHGLHLPVWVLVAWVVILGTIVPFFLIVTALRHLPATRVAITAMLEPVVATLVAWAWLDETLGAVQLTGGAIVLAGIALAQTAR